MTIDNLTDVKTGADLPALYLPPASSLPPPTSIQTSKLCVIYARFSTSGQKETSIERQVEDCRLYIAENELQLVDTYADRGVSGATDEREELYRLREDAKKGRFTHLVIESLDRLARKLRIAVDIFEELLDLDIVLHDAEEGRSLSIIDVGLKGASAQAARDLLVKRNKAGKRRNAARGTFGVASCFGYERYWDENTQSVLWRKNEKEAALVVEAYELFASGVSVPRIVDIFNARPAIERAGKQWTRNFLIGSKRFGSGMLRRVRYVGLRVHGRCKLEKVKDKDGKEKWTLSLHPPTHWVVGNLDPSLQIVTKDLFDRVQTILNERSEAAAAARPTIPRYTAKHAPLRGLIRCAHCGAGMTPTLKRREGKPRLLCNRARNRDGCTNNHSFIVGAVEDEIHRLLAQNLGTPEALAPYLATYNETRHERLSGAEEKKKELERTRHTLIRRMDRIRDDEENNRYPSNYLEEARLKTNTEYVEIEKHLAELAMLIHDAEKGIDPATRIDAHRMLLDSLANVFSDSFDAQSETGTKVVAALRQLIHSIVLDIDDSGCSIEMKCRIGSERDDSEDNLATFSSRLERTSRKWESSIRETHRVAKIAERGVRSVTDEEWEKIAYLVPDSVARSNRGGASVDKRNVVNAALLHLWEGVPLLHMPTNFGPADAVFAGLKRLSATGSWDAVANALRRISPGRVPNVESNMFSTDPRKLSHSLRALPLIKAQHGLAAAAGEHAPSEEVWKRVKNLIPEKVLQVHKEAAAIEARTFLHGVLYWLNKDIPMHHLPLMFGSYKHFNLALCCLAESGKLDELVRVMLEMSPSPLKSADISKLDRFPRATREKAVWRSSLQKKCNVEGIPAHAPDEKTWNLIQHLFPPELLFVNDDAVIKSPQRLAHAILFRLREPISFATMPTYFGDPQKVQLVVTKWVFHHLWDECKLILDKHAPEVLHGADLHVFDKYKRGRLRRYRDLIHSERPPIPPHQPSEDDFAFFRDLIPEDVLCLRGGPAIMTPRKFFHAIAFMLQEHTLFGGLPPYFGNKHEIRVAMRKMVRHHFWDTMRARIEHFEPDWASGANLTLFDNMDRSSTHEPGFRRRRIFK